MVVQIINNSQFPNPFYQTPLSAGMDLYANFEEDEIVIPAHGRRLVKTGIHIALPAGYEAQIRPRSGMAYKHGITVLNSPGTIDADYIDEVGVLLHNTNSMPVSIPRGERIAQMVVAKHETVTWENVEVLAKTERNGGWGSTGTK